MEKTDKQPDITELTIDEAVAILDAIILNPMIPRQNGKSGRDLIVFLAWLKIKEVLGK